MSTNSIYFVAQMACANEIYGCPSRASVEVSLPPKLDLMHIPDHPQLFHTPVPDGWKHFNTLQGMPRPGIYCPLCVENPDRLNEDEDEDEDDDDD